MSNRNLKFLLLLLIVTALAGWLLDWWLACGAFVGAAVATLIYQRRYSVVDEIETEWHWYTARGWRDQPPGEDNPYWSELWRPALLVVVLVVVLVGVVAGII